MEKSDLYQSLLEDFSATFIAELMPGILHNFANPLNGIMGRSKLLQRRIDDVVKKITEQYPDAATALQSDLDRVKNDVRAVNRETESFFYMFRNVSGKFYALASRGQERINISQLLEAEVRFADFYLDFKHEIVKNTQLDKEIPEIIGNLAELSLVFWRLIRFAMTHVMKGGSNKECLIKTFLEDEQIIVKIQFSGPPFSDEEKIFFTGELNDHHYPLPYKGVIYSLQILKQYPAKITLEQPEEGNVISVTLSYKMMQN